jgi:hypothetical protein
MASRDVAIAVDDALVKQPRAAIRGNGVHPPRQVMHRVVITSAILGDVEYIS